MWWHLTGKPPLPTLTTQAADEEAEAGAPAAVDPDSAPEASVAAAEASEQQPAAAPIAPSGYRGERNLGRDFYNKRFRLLLNHVVESGPPLTEPALLHDQEVGVVDACRVRSCCFVATAFLDHVDHVLYISIRGDRQVLNIHNSIYDSVGACPRSSGRWPW